MGYNMGLTELDIDTDIGIIDDVDLNTHLGKLGYGVTEDLEVYGLYGISSIETRPFDSSNDEAYGFGAKLNLYKKDNLSIGAAYQMIWLQGDDNIGIGGEVPQNLKVSADLYTTTLALGPQLQITKAISIYGGGLVYMMNGDVKVGSFETDIDEDIKYGSYAGANILVTPNISISGEYQQLNDGHLIGGGVVIRF